MSAYDRLADYIDVPERIRLFLEAFPEGSLQSHPAKPWKITEVDGKHFVVYTALAYRSPDDKRPGEGTAWEPFPGQTPYTRNSELQNAETSAWGRAIVALGIGAKKIASADEVRNRQAENGDPAARQKRPSNEQFKRLGTLLDDLEKTSPTAEGQQSWTKRAQEWSKERFGVTSRKDMTPEQMSELIETAQSWLDDARIPFG